MTDKERKVAREEIIHDLVKHDENLSKRSGKVADVSDMAALHGIIRVRSGHKEAPINVREVIETARAVAAERGMQVPDGRRGRKR